MSDPSLAVEIAIKAGKAVIGAEEAVRAEEKVEKGAAKIAREAKKAEEAMDRFAKRTKELNATPLEKHEAMMQRLNQAFRAGKLTQDDYTRAVQRSRSALDVLKNAQGAAGGPEATGQIKTYATGWLSVGAAIGFATAALQAHEVKRQGAMGRMKDLTDLRIELGQVGGQELKDKAASLTKFGLTQREAMQLTLNAQNLGFLGDVEHFAANKAGLGDLNAIGEVAGLIPQQFGGKINARESANMTLAAAGPSRLSPAGMAPLISRFAEGAIDQGTSPDEVFAWASVMAQKFASPEQAAHYTGSFQTRMSIDENLKGKGIIGGIQALMAMPEAEQREFLKKDKETNVFFSRAKEAQGEVKLRMAEIAAARAGTGAPGDLTAAATANNLRDPFIASSLKNTASEAAQQAVEEQTLAVEATDANSQMRDVSARLTKRGDSGFRVLVAEKLMAVADATLGAAAGATAGKLYAGPLGRVSDALSTGGLSEIVGALQQIGQIVTLLERIAGNVDRAGRAVQAGALASMN